MKSLKSGLFERDGKWFRSGFVSGPHDSMIEAVDTAMNGGLTITDVSYILPSHGITIGECFEQDAKSTLSFLAREKGLIEQHYSPRACHQVRDNLVKILDKQTDENFSGHIILRGILEEMVGVCENKMNEAGIPLKEPYYKK